MLKLAFYANLIPGIEDTRTPSHHTLGEKSHKIYIFKSIPSPSEGLNWAARADLLRKLIIKNWTCFWVGRFKYG